MYEVVKITWKWFTFNFVSRSGIANDDTPTTAGKKEWD